MVEPVGRLEGEGIMQRRARISGILAVVMVGAMFLAGCAVQQQQTGPTPEELAAQRDSIAKANERELKIARMFAYDKLKQNDYAGARRYLWKVINLDVKDQYNDWARLYQTYIESDQTDSATIVLRMGLQHHPDDPFLNSTLGFILKAQGQYQDALDLYLKAIENDSSNVDYHKKAAELYEALDDPDNAITQYEIVVKLNPDDTDAKDKLTGLYRRFRDPEDYIKRLEQDVASQPDNMNKRMELLGAYDDQGLNEKVVSQADSIIARDPEMREAYRRKAQALENLNRLPQAIETYKTLLEKHPEYNEARMRIADDYRLLDQFVSARNWVLDARKNADGESAEADFILGQVYESAGDKCSGGRGLEFDDKLVYVIAYGLYQKAANGSDYSVKDKAERKLQYLDQFVPKYSDWFMNQTKKMPAANCYDWINPSWPEAGYLSTYLKQVSESK